MFDGRRRGDSGGDGCGRLLVRRLLGGAGRECYGADSRQEDGAERLLGSQQPGHEGVTAAGEATKRRTDRALGLPQPPLHCGHRDTQGGRQLGGGSPLAATQPQRPTSLVERTEGPGCCDALLERGMGTARARGLDASAALGGAALGQRDVAADPPDPAAFRTGWVEVAAPPHEHEEHLLLGVLERRAHHAQAAERRTDEASMLGDQRVRGPHVVSCHDRGGVGVPALNTATTPCPHAGGSARCR